MHGLTSAWILKALNDNNQGKLISIDLPRRLWNEYFPDQEMGPNFEAELDIGDNNPGWIIPEDLLNDWELHIGPSNKHLESLLDHNSVDLFIHDSDHSYEIMSYECLTAFEKIPDAMFVIDNFNMCDFTLEYLGSNKMNYMFMDEVDDSNNIETCTAFCKFP